MKNIIAILTLLLLASCGRDAELLSVDSQLASIPGRFSFESGQKVNESVREINMFSFPLASEVSNFYFNDDSAAFNRDTWDRVFSELDFADFYKDGVPLELENGKKVRQTVSSILSIGLARDKAWQRHVKFIRLRNELKETLHDKFFSKYPCHKVIKGKNKHKCYSRHLEGVTETKSENDSSSETEEIDNVEVPKITYSTTCSSFKRKLKKFKKIKEDTRIPEGTRAEYVLNDANLKQYKEDLRDCKTEDAGKLSKYSAHAAAAQEVRVDGKALVREMLKDAEVSSGMKYLATAITETDLDTTGSGLTSTLDIDLETMTVRKFNLAIDFHLGNAFKSFNPELGNMSTPVIKKKFNQRTGQAFYTLHFEMYPKGELGNFVYSTDEKGLSINTDGEFNVRISGKTLWKYSNGTLRNGIMKIELNYKK